MSFFHILPLINFASNMKQFKIIMININCDCHSNRVSVYTRFELQKCPNYDMNVNNYSHSQFKSSNCTPTRFVTAYGINSHTNSFNRLFKSNRAGGCFCGSFRFLSGREVCLKSMSIFPQRNWQKHEAKVKCLIIIMMH